MAKLGLLGALGGLGAGLQDVGKQLYLRRERALEEARELAKEERNRAFLSTEKQKDRDFDRETTTKLEEGRAARTEATLNVRRAEGEANRRSKEQTAAANRAAQKELVNLRAKLERSNDDAAKRLSDQLSADDVHAVQYGETRADGRARVYTIRKNGTVTPTNSWMLPPRNYRPYTEEDEDEGL